MPRRNAKVELTAEFVRSVLDYDAKTGVFRWKKRPSARRNWNTRYAGMIAGAIMKTGYAYIEIGGNSPQPAHRLAWLHFYGEFPGGQIDHRNGNRAANNIDNLRDTTPTGNGANKAMQRNNASGFIGVHFDSQHGRWRARISYARATVDVGFFDTAQEAASARAQRVREIQGEFAPDTVRSAAYVHHRDR